ncbi:ThiF family adenylyltransferase [candidate division WOR-3 bacterium]|nr:ThiF family adenylyltransferase [candidate division WOR-3 bacterium]
MTRFIGSPKPRPAKYITREIKPTVTGEAKITDRQERIPGFSQEVLERLSVVMIGGGGLGGEIGEGLVRKGVGELRIFDGDVVELSNLNRQRFYKKDLYKNKARCLAKNLAREAVKNSIIIGYPFRFQEAVEENIDVSCDLAICGVDNNPTRAYVSKYFYRRETPVVFTAVSRDANNGYVFIQEPDKACFGCLFPNAMNDTTEPCPGVPAIKDILKAVAGLTLYAVDSVFMNRRRNWNYKEIFLASFVPDKAFWVKRKDNCPLYGEHST